MGRDMLAFAKEIFAAHGVAGEPQRLSGGWTNCVFAAGDYVLRCTSDTENGRLRRETHLAKMLPPDVGYPAIVDSGATNGCDWMLCKRISGTNLEDAWPKLSWDERADALEQLWKRAKNVHTLDTETARPFVNQTLWYFSTVENALCEADFLLKRGLLSEQQCEAVKGYIHRYEEAMKSAKCVVAHGDLTPANAMWYDGEVNALMDFECAVIAPKEADLMMLLNTAYDRGDLLGEGDAFVVGSRPEASLGGDRASEEGPTFEAEQRFNERMMTLVQNEAPDWHLLHGYEAIKLMHHVTMDVDDEDFSPEHEELVSLLALLESGKGAFLRTVNGR